jgi:DtxR family Mn-dependent transcriptional regulator
VEAERLEHVLSEELEAALDRALGYPDTDPHGDPIPGPDLTLPAETSRALLELEPGDDAVICRVPDDAPLLRYLASLGMVPEARVRMVDKAPFDGPVSLEVDGIQQSLGVAVAGRIRVGPA